MDFDTLRQLVDDDDLGLLDVKPKQCYNLTEDDRLVESFFEINEYYRQYNCEPTKSITDIQQARLAMRLASLRNESGKINTLIGFDEFNLLTPVREIESLDDIFADDDLDILGGADDDSIFNLKNIPKTVDMPDYIAKRKPCNNFEHFEALFVQCHADLQNGKRLARPFSKEQQIEKGQFFVLKGVLVYIEHVGEKVKSAGKMNARLRCVFENGTESDVLLRSLARELYRDGRRVTVHEDRLMDDLNNIVNEDAQTGYVYVLKSLSTNPAIAALNDLYKIGFSTVAVEERIKGAETDPTYLMAAVRVIETFECFNLNPQKLELMLHKFFAKVCLEVDVFDAAGKRFTPREWFIAPLAVIEEVIELILSGEIVDFSYDDQAKMIRQQGSRE